MAYRCFNTILWGKESLLAATVAAAEVGPSADTEPLPGSSVALLAAVVIARDEARHIAMCLEAALKAVTPLPDTRVILVDSNSMDDTVCIASAFPIDVYRYRAAVRTAAAGRRIGASLVRAHYVLFIDGDSQIESTWLPKALDHLQRHAEVAVVYGSRREVYEGVRAEYRSAAVPGEASLGGTALYRAAALRAVGGFHPFLVAEEEGELLARLTAAGYTAAAIPDLMCTHHTIPKDTVRGHLRRVERRMTIGAGQVLRVALGHGLFGYHVRRLNRTLLMLAYLAVGLGCGVAALLGAGVMPAAAWLALGGLAFAALWYRRGQLRSATYIVTDWVLGAIGVVIGFLSPPLPPEHFEPMVEHVASDWSVSRSAVHGMVACRDVRL